jgi:hypothetical protein
MNDISETTPDDLLGIESELRTLRPDAPRLLILQPRPRARAAYASMPVLTLLIGILIGGWSVEGLRPMPQVVEVVRVVEVEREAIAANNSPPVEGWHFAQQNDGVVPQMTTPPLRGTPPKEGNYNPDLDTMLEEYTRRAKLFAHVERVAVMPSPSNGSISDPTSVFRLRETMNL